MTPFDNVTIVVAHGAWADGSSWSKVINGLTKKGLRTVAAPLPLSSLSEDSAALRRTFARTRGSVIVAGHAYAGAVIATANDERVRALVYIAGLAPAQGETVAEVFYRDKAHPIAPQLAPDEDGWIWMPDEGFANAFAQNATADQIALAKAVQRPISVKCIQESAPEPAWKDDKCVPAPVTILRVGTEVTVVGNAASVFRIGIYNDNGAGAPGTLVTNGDCGTIAGDSATVQEITLGTAITLTPGWYWTGGASQNAATTAPTMRCINRTNAYYVYGVGTSIPASSATQLGLATGATVSGALPSPAGTSVIAGSVARIFFKIQ